jgi:hypothetical protein
VEIKWLATVMEGAMAMSITMVMVDGN